MLKEPSIFETVENESRFVLGKKSSNTKEKYSESYWLHLEYNEHFSFFFLTILWSFSLKTSFFICKYWRLSSDLLGLFLWHINNCRLFNAKSSLYIYITYIWFGLVGFYGISTIVDYFIPNHLHTYILNIYDLVWLGFMVYQPL